ncbi:MAG: AMP-binding protein [Acidimicrobiia bacterium]|nr:AMP-binding protein [Acidimicrobiia bacterium]
MTWQSAGHVPATPPVTGPEAHLRHIFGLIEPALVICADRTRRGLPAEVIRRVAAAASIRVAVSAAEGARLAVPGPAGCSDPTVDVPEETAHLMFTSSTTGPPKAVSHSEDTLATLNRQFAERFSLSSETPVFMPSPLSHSVGAIHGARLSLFLGAPPILQDEWVAAAALELVARHRGAFTAAATPTSTAPRCAWPPRRARSPSMSRCRSPPCCAWPARPATVPCSWAPRTRSSARGSSTSSTRD